MDFIGSYSSSDSETEPLITKTQDDLPKNKEQLLAETREHDKPSLNKNTSQSPREYYQVDKSNATSKDNQTNTVNLHVKRTSTFDVVTNKTGVKPYIPKSKRTKLINEPQSTIASNSDKTCAVSKLSPIFQKAQLLAKANLHRVPKSQVNDFKAHKVSINRVSWNPKFADFLLSASMDSVVKVWNVQTSPCCVYEVDSHSQAVKDAKWNYNGLHILSGGYDKMAQITDINLGKKLCELKHNSFVTSVQYHPSDNNVVLSGTSNDGIFAWDIRTQQIATRYKSFFGQVQDLVFLPDGESFISAAEVLKRNSTDKGIMVWDYKTSTILSNQVFQEVYTCTALQIHPTENVFLAQCNADYIAIFSQKPPYKLNKYKRYEGHRVSGYHIGFDISPDGTLVATGSADGIINIYNYKTSNTLKTLTTNSREPCMDVAWSPSLPSLLASCDWDGRITLHT